MAEVTPETHEQAMVCFRCGLAMAAPIVTFPQDAGLWDWPCPVCGRHSIWITDVHLKPEDDEPMTTVRARSLVEDYLLATFKRGNRRSKGASQ